MFRITLINDHYVSLKPVTTHIPLRIEECIFMLFSKVTSMRPCTVFSNFTSFLYCYRTGGEENFFHCNRCECCYSNLLKESHLCIEKAMHHNCPVCFEYLFDTTKDITVLPCGHTIHLECVKEMEIRFQYACPVCLKSYCDMTRVWEKLDQEVASTPMPQMYQNKMVWILCNDCGGRSEVNYHIVAHKCLNCNSYNTRQTRGHTSCSSGVSEAVRWSSWCFSIAMNSLQVRSSLSGYDLRPVGDSS